MKWRLAVWVLALAAATLLLYTRSIRNARVQESVKEFATQLHPGMPSPDVARLLQQIGQSHQVSDSDLRVNSEQQFWKITTPSQWGATNWTIELDYDAQNQLTHRRVRTADSSTRKPDSAPVDF